MRFAVLLQSTIMTDVTQILTRIDEGDPVASEQLLPLVYDELRHLAEQKLALEAPGQTLQATALVHEAYLRLVGQEQPWDNRGHFFAAAAEAMRRILIDRVRQRLSQRRGGSLKRHDIERVEIVDPDPSMELLALNEALLEFETVDARKADLVKLRYFAGLTIPEAARALGLSTATANRYWAYARAWLHAAIKKDGTHLD